MKSTRLSGAVAVLEARNAPAIAGLDFTNSYCARIE